MLEVLEKLKDVLKVEKHKIEAVGHKKGNSKVRVGVMLAKEILMLMFILKTSKYLGRCTGLRKCSPRQE